MNLFAYADGIVLLAPSWRGLQSLLRMLEKAAADLSMSFNTVKTVCMVFDPKDSKKLLHKSIVFPQFMLGGRQLSFVKEFKYLGNIIDDSLSDDNDIKREIRCLFTRTK